MMEAKREGSMKVGVFTVGLPDLTPEEAVRELEDAGYDGVEWRVTRVPEEAMRFAVTAGASQIRVGAGAPDGRSYNELFASAREFLAGVEELVRSHGVKALIEVHHRTICPSASLAHRLVSAFDPDLVGVILDPGNMAQEGFENYRIGAELLGPYLAHVHIKNSAF